MSASFATDLLRELGYERRARGANRMRGSRCSKRLPRGGGLLLPRVAPARRNDRPPARDHAVQAPSRLKCLYTTLYARNAIASSGALDPGVELIVTPFTTPPLAAGSASARAAVIRGGLKHAVCYNL